MLPMTETLLKPAYDTTTDAEAARGKRAKQAHYYNRQARDLPPIQEGETVRLQLPGQKQWTPGTCTGTQDPRSYRVRVGGTEYRRNRRHLIQRGEPPPVEPGEPPQPESSEQTQPEEPEDPAPGLGPPLPMAQPPEPGPEHVAQSQQRPASSNNEPHQLRRSARQRRTPEWITTYVPS